MIRHFVFRGGIPLIFLIKIADFRKFHPNHFLRSIRRTVVCNNDFEVAERLIFQRFQ